MKTGFRFTTLFLVLVLLFSITGAFAAWIYPESGPQEQSADISLSLDEFHYGTLYISRLSVKQGNYQSADVTIAADLDIRADLTLNANAASTVVAEVTFYNNTDASFYYNKTETISSDNDHIAYTVSGIETKDEIPAKSFKTVTVTFAYTGNDFSDSSLLSSLHFNFVVDKNSITGVVAQTAVDRFRDILNNKVSSDSYQTLETAMNNRDGLNKGSAVTYIGNVSGSSSNDSKLIQSLFGTEFMSMDLDGDGKAEPITMMIKRENLDGSASTGASYTYTTDSWWGNTESHTVNGVEMTLYITAEGLSGSSGRSVVVYAASFTKLPGSDTWTDFVPLTKGTAKTNNYGGYGSANSFNTDTWTSESGKTIRELIG